LGAMHRSRPFRGVLYGTSPELYVLVAAQIVERLGLRRFIVDAETARDKLAMRNALSPVVRCPETRLLRSIDDVLALEGIEFPCVVKPREGFGSMGVVKVRDRGELVREFKQKSANASYMARRQPLVGVTGDLLVEQFISGTEHTVDAFVRDSRVVFHAISDKFAMRPPYFVEVGDVMPSRLPAEAAERIVETVRDATRALGIEHGWTHTEVKLDDGVPCVMEVAARGGGGYTRSMLKVAYGVDARKVLIDSYLDEPPEWPVEPLSTFVGRTIVSYGITVVWRVDGIERCRRTGCFREISQRLQGKPRVLLGPPYSYENAVMSYSVADPARDRAMALVEEVDKTIRVHSVSVLEGSRVAHAVFLATLRFLDRLPRIRAMLAAALHPDR